MSADQPSGHSPLKATSPPGIRTTTKFSAAHAALPRLLPFAEPGRLVFLFTTQADPGEGLVLTRWSRPLIDTLTASYAYRKDSVARSPELYQAATLTRIRAGANVTLPEYIESRRQLDRIRHSGSRAFDTVDLLITPTVPVPPFPITDLARVAYTSCWSGRTTCGRLRKRA